MELHEQHSPRRRALWWWISGALVIAIVVAAVALTAQRANGTAGHEKGKKKKGDDPPPAAPVELAQVRTGSISTFLANTTTLEARNSAVLVARRRGQVIGLPAEEGMWVETGATLARLDDHEAKLAVQRTELALEMAKRELERGKQLHAQGYLSSKELDDLELKVKNAWVELEQARYDLTQMKIVAPFSGRVVARTVNLGETVTEGKECFRVDAFDPILARVYFPERELSRVRVGQQGMLTLDSHPGQAFRGKVSLVNPVVDRANGTFKVTLEIANHDGRLRPGAFARVQLKTGDFPGAVLVPRRALLSEDGEDYVFVARADSVVRLAVRVGAVDGDTAQVLSGLGTGERIVTVGHGGLKPGAKIKPVTL
jgi:membrane fusion protein (multidrug efflux system)